MDDQVAEIKSRVDIVSVIGERIDLKKAGRNYKANCPFHGEKTPSFMVSQELQIFKCFGCGEAGDVYSFLEKYEGMDFAEALKFLADKVGIKLNRRSGEVSEKEKLIEIHLAALKFYQYFLQVHPLGKKTLEYLIKERGLMKSTIEEFGLGYSPENPLPINKFLINKKKFDPSDISRSGIGGIRGQGKYGRSIYDRFSGRVVFPLYDHRGNPVGFSGRLLPWDRRDTGKYINSPETPIYHKSSILYGLNFTRGAIKKKKVAIVVEGELDLISSYQAGIKNVVAIKGSALTDEQVRLLSRFTQRLIIALDSDFAGDSAARRGITVAENSGVEVKVATISDYKDPDEAVRKNLNSFKSDLIHAKGVWDFLIESVLSRYKENTGENKARISRELIPILSSIEDKIVQAHYSNIVAERLDVPLEAVSEQIIKMAGLGIMPPVSVSSSDNGQPMQVAHGRRDLLEERLLTLGFQSDPAILLGKDVVKLVCNNLYSRILAELSKFVKANGKFDTHNFGIILPSELFEGFAKIVLKENQNLSDRPEELKEELDLVKKELKILGIKDSLRLLTVKMREFEKNGDKVQLLKAQNDFSKLAKSLASLGTADSGGVIFSE